MATKKKDMAEMTAEIEEAVEEVEEFDANAYFSELVPFYAFKDSDKYKDDITGGFNGSIFQIKRGEQVMIPRYVYKILERSMKQDAHTADLINNQAKAYAAEARIWNA